MSADRLRRLTELEARDRRRRGVRLDMTGLSLGDLEFLESLRDVSAADLGEDVVARWHARVAACPQRELVGGAQ